MREIYYMSPKIHGTETYSYGFLEISGTNYRKYGINGRGSNSIRRKFCPGFTKQKSRFVTATN